MSKRELIDRIRLFNPTAASSFLAEFGEDDLHQYLQHLTATMPPPRMAIFQPTAPAAEAPAASHDPRQLALVF
jgi:hypothetical protein